MLANSGNLSIARSSRNGSAPAWLNYRKGSHRPCPARRRLRIRTHLSVAQCAGLRSLFAHARKHRRSRRSGQETFLVVLRKIRTFRGESAFSTWLHRITINIVLGVCEEKPHSNLLLRKMKSGKAIARSSARSLPPPTCSWLARSTASILSAQ